MYKSSILPAVFFFFFFFLDSSCGESGSQAADEPQPAANPAQPSSPEEMPDREADPMAFLYWRVDRLFTEQDGNGDGFLDPDEYRGPSGSEDKRTATFNRIDADADGRIAQDEMIGDSIAMNPELYKGE